MAWPGSAWLLLSFSARSILSGHPVHQTAQNGSKPNTRSFIMKDFWVKLTEKAVCPSLGRGSIMMLLQPLDALRPRSPVGAGVLWGIQARTILISGGKRKKRKGFVLFWPRKENCSTWRMNLSSLSSFLQPFYAWCPSRHANEKFAEKFPPFVLFI